MGSCCSRTVVFTRDVIDDLRQKCSELPSVKELCNCRSCKCWSLKEVDPELTISTQTEDVVFQLMKSPNIRLNLLKGGNSTGERTARNYSTENNSSQLALAPVRRNSPSAGRRGSSDRKESSISLATSSLEEILAIIERVQDICGSVSMKEQVTLLCTVGLLRDYCITLKDQQCEQSNTRFTKEGKEVDEGRRNSAVNFWVTAYSGQARRDSTGGVKRFKKIAMGVKSAIILAGRAGHSFSTPLPSISMEIPVPYNSSLSSVRYLSENMLNWNFDQIEFHEITSHHGIAFLFREILKAANLFAEFNIDSTKMVNYCMEIEKGYQLHNNPYHNEMHGADVLHTTYYLITDTHIREWLSSLEILSLLFAAMIHDVEHTGTNNVFHQQSSSKLALLYNDKSILENHHVSRAYQIINDDPELNPYSSMSPVQFRTMRDIVVECVLSTDMANHFKQVTSLKNTDIDITLVKRQDLMNAILHCADISAPAKRWDIHEKWTHLLMQEFFAQGDLEVQMGLHVSPLCDRETTNIPESQIGFISYITTPAFDALGNSIDSILRDKQEQEFIVKTSPWVKNRRGSLSKALTPVEVPSSSPDDGSFRQRAKSRSLPLTHPNFFYRPINRVWEKNFEENRSRWQEQLDEMRAD